MNNKELIKNHPKSIKIIIEWFTKKLLKTLENDGKDVPEEMKEYMKQKGVTEEQIITFIDINPRGFFDVFDDNNILIGIDTVEKNNFYYYIVDNRAKSPKSKKYNSRLNCENGAFEKAINLLEKTLK